MNFLVTGATGFVGKAFTQATCQQGHDVSALVRMHSRLLPAEVKQIEVGDFLLLAEAFQTRLGSSVISSEVEKSRYSSTAVGITAEFDFEQLISVMKGVDVVIHTAARAHVMKEDHADPAAIYHLMNVTLTEQLVQAAAEAGVKRFVFISSIKVNGEATYEKPFTESDTPAPMDDYGRSKWAAEQALTEIGIQTGMEIIILRPPLVYGPGVKGNFASLIKLVKKGVPLPFGAVNNRRSLIALDKLVSAILTAATHPAAANQTYLVADDEAISTTRLIRLIAEAQGKKVWLIPVPVSWMKFAAGLLAKKAMADRLFGSLEVDASKIQHQLCWQPAVTMMQQLGNDDSSLDGFPPPRV